MIPNSTDNPLEPENGTGDIELGYETPIKVFQAITVWTALFGLPGNIFAYLTASKFTQRLVYTVGYYKLRYHTLNHGALHLHWAPSNFAENLR